MPTEIFPLPALPSISGKDELAEEFYERSLYYRNIFNTEKTFMLSKDKEGKERDDWTQFDWGGTTPRAALGRIPLPFFHDFAGLADLMGGRDKMIEKWTSCLPLRLFFNGCGYGGLIHEMSEMASVDFGQRALSNQPSFHIPYIYSYMGAPDKTAFWVRRACKELFNWEIRAIRRRGQRKHKRLVCFLGSRILSRLPVGCRICRRFAHG